ncbi:nucleotide-sugar transporter [Dichotomocladium elegans]|nr:nucleotide-sugar transporter [Dichotomocladium elegans]
MRYTRANVPADQQYLSTTAVFTNEILKWIICFSALYIGTGHYSFRRVMTRLHYEFMVQWRTSIKSAVPAVIYLIQNNLQYIAASKLDVATFSVTYQLKILTTAFFSWLMLQKVLTRAQWSALALLTLGIALVVLSSSTPSSDVGSSAMAVGNQTDFGGYAAVLSACVLSGMAAVYTEKIIKRKPRNHLVLDPSVGDKDMTLWWVDNMRLATFSVLFGVMSLIQDMGVIQDKGFFAHYTGWTWCVILLQAIGGLVVGLVVKFADSILKGFATSISIILSSLMSVWLFEFSLSGTFVVGAAMVLYASYLYGP